MVEELTSHLADRLLFFGEGKIHGRLMPRLSARRPELVQHQFVAARDCFELLVEDLDGHTDLDGRRFDIAQVRHDAHTFVELDQCHDIGYWRKGSGGYCGITKL